MQLAIRDDDIDPRELRDLFDVACELEDGARRDFLEEHCVGRPALRERIEGLLSADTEAVADARWTLPALLCEAGRLAAEDELPFDRIGPYRVLSRIGAGGMGTVYLAERDYDGHIGRAAIKVIPRILADPENIDRFVRERHILARLNHPHIARMLDAGRTEDGVPWLAMEYVDGVPIERFAKERGLQPKARLELFETICDAVMYAHRNLVVHRDLKPANILVTADGVVKLLDFGIAKLLSENSAEGATSSAIMTPAYASPEQIAGGAITTSSDVYSLGVILYELISGEKCTAPRKRLKGDIENVVSMALRQEPERRYASADDLGEDARRALEGFPVRARPDSLGYRSRRLIARRPIEFALLAAMSVAVCIAALLAFQQYREAQRRFAEVRATANSFLFGIEDALAGLPGTTRARMLVAQRGQQYLDTLASDRSSDMTLKHELASAYRKFGDILGQPFSPNLGDFDGAARDYSKAEALFASIASAGRADAGVYIEWGQVLTHQCQIAIRQSAPEKAIAYGEKAVQVLEKAVAFNPGSRDAQVALLGGRQALVLASLTRSLSNGSLAAYQKAAADAAEALKTARLLSGRYPGDEIIQKALAAACEYRVYTGNDLRRVTGTARASSDEVMLVREEVSITRGLFDRSPDRYRRALADAYTDLALTLAFTGDAAGAETAARESLRRFEESAGADRDDLEAFRDVAVAHWSLARAMAAGNHRPQATAEYEKVAADYERLGKTNPADRHDGVFIEANDWLAEWYLKRGERARALGYYRSNIGALTGQSGADAVVALALDEERLGDALAPTDPASAVDCYRDAATIWKRLGDAGPLLPVDAEKPKEVERKLSAFK
jgi:non-specific serine/threonine protein kinase/serine/threonine-protein kinase